jgi:hypothetical protein
MRAHPVPGWRASVSDLGVPAAPLGLDQGMIATDNDPFESRPLVGYIDERAYFLAGSSTVPSRQWWLIGIDVRNGRPLFAPVALDIGSAAPRCFLNGTTTVLCIRDDGDVRNSVKGGIAWVIDTKQGIVTYAGPTDLRTYPGKLGVAQVGIYAVAESMHTGVYGIGPKADTTWFVPGDGKPSSKYPDNSDFPPPTLATQADANPSSFMNSVFSVRDGKVIAPQIEENAQQRKTRVYPGGFAAEIRVSQTDSQIRFFDETGKLTSRPGIDGSLADIDIPLPIVNSKDSWAAFTTDGRELLKQQGRPSREALIVGEKLLMRDSSDSIAVRWRQFDLQTGEQGKTCEHNLGVGYLGTDGSAVVIEDGNPNVGLVTKARDLATCDTLWTLTSPVGSFRDVWRINTTLVQLSDDGTELMSLVAPG